MVMPKFSSFILLFLVILLLLPSTAMAWTGAVHDYMCPEGYDIDCKIADSPDFKRNYPFGGSNCHLCYDNKTDGLARLVAKYYVKKYYAEGQKDSNLLGAASHLLQDANCPDHWYPMREILGNVFVPFAPSWVGTIEFRVEDYRRNGVEDWNIQIEFQGRVININDAYLRKQREHIQDFISNEPQESLEEIEKQVESRTFWHNLRSTKEWILLGAILMTPILAYCVWQWKKKAKTTRKKSDLIEPILVLMILAAFLSLLLLTVLFY